MKYNIGMETKNLLQQLYETVVGAEPPKNYAEQVKDKLEESGLFKLKAFSAKEMYETRLEDTFAILLKKLPDHGTYDKLDAPDYETKVYPGADEEDIKKTYEWLLECAENFEDVCKLALDTKSGRPYHLGIQLAICIDCYYSYLERDRYGCELYWQEKFLEISNKFKK
jgi:hypothetical protein